MKELIGTKIILVAHFWRGEEGHSWPEVRLVVMDRQGRTSTVVFALANERHNPKVLKDGER